MSRPVALPSGGATVDRVVGARDVGRPVRSDEGHELRDLLGLTEALEKRLSGYRVPGRLVVAGGIGLSAAAHANTPASYRLIERLIGFDRSTALLGAARVASRAASASRMTRAQRSASGIRS